MAPCPLTRQTTVDTLWCRPNEPTPTRLAAYATPDPR